MEVLKIGTTVYSVRKSHSAGDRQLGRIVIGKIRTYQVIKGGLYPVIKEIGVNREIDPVLYHIFDKLSTAISFLKPCTKPKK